MKRRTLLSTLGTTAAGGILAGCIEGADGPGGTDTRVGTPTAAFHVLERTCGQGTNRATVSFDDGTVRVEGTIGGSDTCDTGALEGVELRDGTLTISVVTVRETTEGTPACGQCLTDIDYTATVDLHGTTPESVVVEHDGEVVARASPT